jgi:hypothetical protein
MFRQLIVVLIFTGFRLAEIVQHTSGEIMYLTYESLAWLIGGVVITDPSPEMLAAMRPGLDGALLAPPRAKPDQWGEIHCPFPAMLIFRDDDLNAARALRDIELTYPCHGIARKTTPLFSTDSGQPFTHAYLDRMLKTILLSCFGKGVASVFTWHSFRSGLATALHAAGVSDDMIQLMCRWMCPESLHAYRRVGTSEHDGYLQRASKADVSAVQSANVVRVSADQGFAEIMATSEGRRGRDEEAEYEAALRAAMREPAVAQPMVHASTAAPTPTANAPNLGAHVLVPSAVYPTETCTEHNGEGWTAVLCSSTKHTVKIEFVHARDATGVAYLPVRLPRHCIQPLP